MLKISKLVDYSIVLVVSLAKQSSATISANQCRPISVTRLAQRTSLPEATVAKLMKQLSKQEFVNAQRGINGGYSLNKERLPITALDIIKAIEGPIHIVDCAPSGQSSAQTCDHAHACLMFGHWDSINETIRQSLANIELVDRHGDILQPVSSSQKPLLTSSAARGALGSSDLELVKAPSCGSQSSQGCGCASIKTSCCAPSSPIMPEKSNGTSNS